MFFGNSLESLLDTLTFGEGGGARIKSVQRGVAQLPSMQAQLNIAISPVNLSRSFIILQVELDTWYSAAASYCTAEFANSSTIRIARRTADSNTPYVAWQVVEFAEGATVQHIAASFSSNGNVTISPVDMNKTFLLLTYRTSRESDYYTDKLVNVTYSQVRAYLTAPDTIRVEDVSQNGATVRIEVVEVK